MSQTVPHTPAGDTNPLWVRGDLLHFLRDPGAGDAQAYCHIPDGGLRIEDGHITACGPWAQVTQGLLANAQVADHSGCLILPGFVDTHIHYPQTDIIASPGHGLLDWLERYTFVAEREFSDFAHASGVAEFFLDELLRNGTTCAHVFGTVHAESVNAFFEAAAKRQMRMTAGKVMMDRHAPAFLCDTAQSSYDDSKALIESWHGKGRSRYAVTPRFAVTSSPQQLEAAACLAKEYPDVGIHSHLAENKAEVDYVLKLYPTHKSYLDVYDSYGLLRPGAVYAHCIHLDQAERRRMAQTGAAAAFSPTSNLFLGSGLFDLGQSLAAQMRIGIASDVGGGSSFSILRTLAAAYQVAHLKGHVMPAMQAFYLATLGGAICLGVDRQIGSLELGKEADLVVLDPQCTPLMARRMARASSLEEQLFLYQTLGDDRAVAATYVYGERLWTRP